MVAILESKDVEIENLKQRAREAQERTKLAEEEVKTLGERIQELDNEVEQKEGLLREQAVEIEGLKIKGTELGQISEIHNVSAALEELRQLLAEERVACAEAVEEASQTKRQLEFMEAQYNELKTKEEFVKELGARQKKLEVDHEALLKAKDATIRELDEAVHSLEGQVTEKNSAIQRLQEEREALRELQRKQEQPH